MAKYKKSSVAKFGDFAPNRRLWTWLWRKIFSLATGDFLAISSFPDGKVGKGQLFAKNLICHCPHA